MPRVKNQKSNHNYWFRIAILLLIMVIKLLELLLYIFKT